MIRLDVLGPLALEGGRDPGSILSHPRDLALLAYLAVRGGGAPCTRDQLLAVFWPESDTRRARNALNQALYRLRRGTHADLFVSHGAHQILLNRSRLMTDVRLFREAMTEGDFEEALSVYRAPLLDGFHGPGGNRFEHWLEGERAQLRAEASRAARSLRSKYAGAEELHEALRWARRAVAISNREEEDVLRLIELLATAGERLTAIRVYEQFERWLASELQLVPSADMVAAISAITEVVPPARPSEPTPTTKERGAAPRRDRPLPGLSPAPSGQQEWGSGPHAWRWRRSGARIAALGAALIAVTVLGASGIFLALRESGRASPLAGVPAPARSFYGRGLEYVVNGLDHDRERNWTLALEMFERAVEVAPDFAAAHAEVGMTHLRLFHWGFDRSTSRQVLARGAVERSLELDADLPEAQKALAHQYLWSERDYERALQTGLGAYESLPDDRDLLGLLFGATRRWRGPVEAVPLIERLAAMGSPRSAVYRSELAATYIGMRDYPSARTVLDESITLFPDDFRSRAERFRLALLSSGDVEAGWSVFREARAGFAPELLWPMEFALHWLGRDYDRALGVLERQGPRSFYVQQGQLPIELMYGSVHHVAGRDSVARRYYRKALPALRGKTRSRPDEPWSHGWLGLALAGAGHPDSALVESRLARELAELEPDVWENPYMAQEVLLHTLILAGEHRRAIEMIGELLESRHYRAISRAWIGMDPRFDALRSDPAFHRVMAGGA